MEDSILNGVKKSIGIMPEYDVFDDSLIMHINSVFMILAQMGVGPSKGFRIEDDTDKWSDFLSNDDENYESIKSYVCMKVRLLFDPPSSSTHMDCIKQLVSEFEWRLNFEAEESK
jgi:hypothetical protein